MDIVKFENKLGLDFTDYVHYFVKVIHDMVDDTDFETYSPLEATIETYEYPYYYDAINLITRTFQMLGYDTRLPSYKKAVDEDGDEMHIYMWTIRLKGDSTSGNDDLPY